MQSKKELNGNAEYRNSTHVWMFEPKIDGLHVLSLQGMENIANHKYKSGEYTHLDNFLNPFWAYLTELLPMWLAPNMVTTIGGLHCAFSYSLLWYHSRNMAEIVPSWVLLVSAWCSFVYYTFDCMDGKQARRTGMSSPLGQLFDHGFDCICTLSHISCCTGFAAIALGYDAKFFFLLQCSLQFAFFMAQWEEYYTHVLPHAAGKWLGVTEVNYGITLLTLSNTFIDREAFWHSTLENFLPAAFHVEFMKPFISLHVVHACITIWGAATVVMISMSFLRVYTHKDMSNKEFFSAVTKLISPLTLVIATFMLPGTVLTLYTREISLTVGLMFCLITNKMIVFSMAKMAYASVQISIIPYVLFSIWIKYDPNFSNLRYKMLVIALWHLVCLLFWCKVAINQICARLDINCFTIKEKHNDKKGK